jgi:NADPH:quinone reductase-like Zn-dependent oxidoreductase
MIVWNRLRYTAWAPAYDAIVRAAGFDTARRLSIDRLPFRLAAGLRKPRFIIGNDIARRVEAVGRQVTQFRPGDHVFGELSRGSERLGNLDRQRPDAAGCAFNASAFSGATANSEYAPMPHRCLRGA